PWAHAEGARGVDHLRVDGDGVAVHEGEDHVEVHVRALLLEVDGDHPLGELLLEEALGHQLRHLCGGALADADEHGAVAQGITSPASIAARPKACTSNASCSSPWPASGKMKSTPASRNIGWER